MTNPPTDQPNVPRVLVTGGYGCIGAETVKWLVRKTPSQVVVCSRNVSEDRHGTAFSELDASRVTPVAGDVRNQSQVEALLGDYRITHVVHMAGLQTPDCNAHRDVGLQTNLAGTQNILEAIKVVNPALKRFIFASSVAVYGGRTSYPAGQVPMLSRPNPVNVYGVWKQAGEEVTRLFHSETGISALSLRPAVLFGPGRDLGLTAAPTTAMKHVALGSPYEIPFRNRQDYLYAPDVGAAVGTATLEEFSGYATFTLPSHTVDTIEFLEAIQQAAKSLGIESQCRITIGEQEVPFICDLQYQPFVDAFPSVPHTPLKQAVRQSLETYLELKQADSLQA